MGKKIKSPFNTKPIILSAMAIFVALIIIYILVAMQKKTSPNANQAITPTILLETTIMDDKTYQEEVSILAIVRDVDSENKTIALINVETDESITLPYVGSTQVLDKYNKVLSAKQLKAGDMVDVIYNGVTRKIYKIQISTRGWELKGINKLLINSDKRVISFQNIRYRVGDGLLVIDNGKQIDLGTIIKKDVVTIRGYDQKICAILLTRGHGYLKLGDADAFLGGNIYVGSKWEQITEDMLLTVMEGEYKVTVERGDYTGSETIKITRNEIVTFNIGAYGPVAKSLGRAYFTIQPDNAVLYIDNIVKNYNEPIELTYGIHSIEVSLGGYQTYKRDITIDRTENQFSISLAQNPLGQESTEEYTDEYNDPNVTTDPNLENPEVTTIVGLSPTPSLNEVQDEDNTSEVTLRIDKNHTITVSCTSGAEVYFDGTYVGEIENGKVVVPKYIGVFEVDFYLEGHETKSYTIEVTDDGENVNYEFPEF